MAALIHRERREVDRRLKQYFWSDRNQWIEVVKAAVAARAGCTTDYPKASPGFYAWSAGSGRMRQIFCREGYLKGDEDGIETIFHPDLKVKIAIVNTDRGTCDLDRSPRNRTPKGPAQDRVTDLNNQFEMFKRGQIEERPLGIPLWHLCIFDNGTVVRAEISRPVEFVGGHWIKYSERIFIIEGDDWARIVVTSPQESPSSDYEIKIKRR